MWTMIWNQLAFLNLNICAYVWNMWENSIFPSEYQGNDIRKIRPRYIWQSRRWRQKFAHNIISNSYYINTIGFLQSSTNKLYTINLIMNWASCWHLFPRNHKFTVYLKISTTYCQIIRYSFYWWKIANSSSPKSIVAFQNGWAGLFWDATKIRMTCEYLFVILTFCQCLK